MVIIMIVMINICFHYMIIILSAFIKSHQKDSQYMIYPSILQSTNISSTKSNK